MLPTNIHRFELLADSVKQLHRPTLASAAPASDLRGVISQLIVCRLNRQFIWEEALLLERTGLEF
jgi:hypothetical protein